MPAAPISSGLTIEYETFGSEADPAMLLVAGFGAQLLSWEVGLCERIARAGFYVIRFDNRDAGLSTKLDGQIPDLAAIIAALRRGDREEAIRLAPYSLHDMADDGFGLLSALQIEQAHLVGASLGAMIVQLMAIERPQRVLSLTSIMSHTGERDFGGAAPGVMEALVAPSPTEREASIAATVAKNLLWVSKRYRDPERLAARAGRAYDRSFYPEGKLRQNAAVLVSGTRADALRTLRVPMLVIHGLDDTLIQPSGGERTAELVPGARLLLLADMGHDLPEPLWPEICDAITDVASAAPKR